MNKCNHNWIKIRELSVHIEEGCNACAYKPKRGFGLFSSWDFCPPHRHKIGVLVQCANCDSSKELWGKNDK